MILKFTFCRQSDQKIDIIRLNIRFMCRTAAFYSTAFLTAVSYNKSPTRIRFGGYRFKQTAAFTGAVAGIFVNMY